MCMFFRPVNQDSTFKIIGDEMEYVDEKIIKNEKPEEFPEEDVVDCNNDDCGDGDAEDEAEDDFDDNDMDLDDDCPADDDYDENDEDDDDFGDGINICIIVIKLLSKKKIKTFKIFLGFDYKPDKPFYEEPKTSADLSDGSSSCTKPKNKRPTLLGGIKNTWRGHSHHFQR